MGQGGAGQSFVFLLSCELPGQGGGTSSRLTNRPTRPVSTMAPAHKCTDHHTPTVSPSAAKCSVVRRRGTTVAKRRQAPGRCTDGCSQAYTTSAPRAATVRATTGRNG